MTVRIHCSCGARLSRPIPAVCPKCQRPITQVKESAVSWLIPLIVVVGCFVLLVLALFALV